MPIYPLHHVRCMYICVFVCVREMRFNKLEHLIFHVLPKQIYSFFLFNNLSNSFSYCETRVFWLINYIQLGPITVDKTNLKFLSCIFTLTFCLYLYISAFFLFLLFQVCPLPTRFVQWLCTLCIDQIQKTVSLWWNRSWG